MKYALVCFDRGADSARERLRTHVPELDHTVFATCPPTSVFWKPFTTNCVIKGCAIVDNQVIEYDFPWSCVFAMEILSFFRPVSSRKRVLQHTYEYGGVSCSMDGAGFLVHVFLLRG